VATDLFHLNGTTYLVTVDYFSRYPEVAKLQSTTSPTIIRTLKAVFARHGIPETLRSDNGPQFISREFQEFVKEYQFIHTTSSPHYPPSNGQAERMVKTVKNLLKDAEDPYLALLAYRATPLPWCGISPAQLSMGRAIRATLPLTAQNLIPEWSYLQQFRQANKEFKETQKENYDRRHRVRDLPEIPADTPVFVNTNGNVTSGRITSTTDSPRSYYIETPSGMIRRNRTHITIDPGASDNRHDTASQRSPIITRSRSGTDIHPPERLA
jgi:transposase InsO family protein